MFKETLGQSSVEGVPFVECLRQQGILPGIKVDEVLPTAGTRHTLLYSLVVHVVGSSAGDRWI